MLLLIIFVKRDTAWCLRGASLRSRVIWPAFRRHHAVFLFYKGGNKYIINSLK